MSATALGRILRGGRSAHRWAAAADPWRDGAIIRADLFGAERLEDHGMSLARAQSTAGKPRPRPSLVARLRDNSAVLLAAYRSCARAAHDGRTIPPAAEWLLDNFHLVEDQVAQIANDLPPGYYRQLPKLETGPFAGYPRVLGIAWAYVAHTDSLLDREVLARFIRAYQTVQPLTIGELWAIAITLRFVLVENIRRLAVQIVTAQAERAAADDVVDRLLVIEPPGVGLAGPSPMISLAKAVEAFERAPLPEMSAAQFAKRLRAHDPEATPLYAWLNERLRRQGGAIDDAVAQAQLRQGASNVTMRNCITSLRLIAEMDWPDFVEAVSLIDARLRAASDFGRMDFPSRNMYRTAIETLARGSPLSEAEILEAALDIAAQGGAEATRDPGHALIGEGRVALEARVRFAPDWRLRWRRTFARLGLRGYAAAIGLAGAALLLAALAFVGAQGLSAAALALVGLGVAVEAGGALIQIAITKLVPPRRLPGLDLSGGIPPDLRCLVVIPALLADEDDLQRMVEALEVHHLSSGLGALHFALLSDGPDSASETQPKDEGLIDAAFAAFARLNAAYPSETGDRFLFLHRRRLWNPSMGVWMGWERKRGKLTELNRLLRGATDTSFITPHAVPGDIRFVLTLDSDTRLLRDTVIRLVGKIAQPLNRPRFDAALQRVTGGYGILQPRITLALPLGAEGSIFQRVHAGEGGIDMYAAAISDVYQDLFEEGSYTGKGIYDVDAFVSSLAGRTPENTMLSHDLFEGSLARAALVSDVELVEAYPARCDVAAMREHRWVRGDWQLAPWIFGRPARRAEGLPAIARWKMFDNLRRSLTTPLTLLALFVGWLQPPPVALGWTLAVLALLALPFLLHLPFALLSGRRGAPFRNHLLVLAGDAGTALARVALEIAFLPDRAARMVDAIIRTAWRMLVSRRHLLEWVTAAQTTSRDRPGIQGHYFGMAPGLCLGLGVGSLASALNPANWPLVLPFALIWLASPAAAERISRGEAARSASAPTGPERAALRRIARRTWRYFETFVTEADQFLPPDNQQETPSPALARRTSPTNIGLYLLSTTAARDFGWIGLVEAAERLDRTLATLERMPRFRGHLYNWHATDDLRVLAPDYVSTVDSGNLAGHLIAVAQACAEWRTAGESGANWRDGFLDALRLAEESAKTEGAAADPALIAGLARLATADDDEPLERLLPLAEEVAALSAERAPPGSDLAFWCEAARACLSSHAADRSADARPVLASLEARARAFALGMDFAFLLVSEKKLMSIGFSVSTNRLDPNCYDLLASEARLASLFAIAKGDVETRHWFRLGRAATPVGAGSALISWSGSMFEYLMPSLVMRAPAGSVLDLTNRRIVSRQQSYGAALGIPWGVSESGYNARDLEMTYQYSNFGVPGLGLKRGLGENRVVAPYATALAAMIAPKEALRNFACLAALGAEGRYGFYEAIDYTPSRLPAGARLAIVRSFMAHHQGMTIAAIANTLQGGRLRARFHAAPMIAAVELLLQERAPRTVASSPPRAEGIAAGAVGAELVPVVRQFLTPGSSAPTAHLLSNGGYSVTLTPTGAGFSRWRGFAVTRWREDATTARHGSFIFARDRVSGEEWSTSLQPTAADPTRHRAVFCEHHAAFTHQGRGLTTLTEIVVSAEDDAEARRVTLTNGGRRAREIELTSYAELALAPQAADLAHPAFSKLFVVTDFLPELGVIVARRRRRSPADPEIWAAHIAVVEGREWAPVQIETDRARFLGQGRTTGDAAMARTALSQTTGTVLDPIFATRRSVIVPPGGTARVAFWTMVADNPDTLLDQVDRHREASSFGRAVTLSWTQAQVQLRHLGVTPAAARDFQRLGGMLIRGDARLRAAPVLGFPAAGPQSALWALGVSGDLPIVLCRIDDPEDAPCLQECLAAHEYLLMRGLDFDLVILNDRAASYIHDLQTVIEVAIRSAQTRPRPEAPGAAPAGRVHALRSDLISPEARANLLAVAGVAFVAGRGGLGRQIDALAPALSAEQRPPSSAPSSSAAASAPAHDTASLEFFNGLGGFAKDGREYVVVLGTGAATPAPWINVIANRYFGFQVSALGSGHVWAANSRENQLTPWSNDPVADPPGDAIYLLDLDSGETWTPTALPIREPGEYVARHGFGYSVFERSAHGIDARMTQFVPLEDPVRITRLTLRNASARTRRLSVTTYAEWVLGPSRGATARHVVTNLDAVTGAIMARNPFSDAFPGAVAFADLGADTESHDADRTSFLGVGGGMVAPRGIGAEPLFGRTGAGLDPCAALQRRLSLAPGETVDVLFLLGQAASEEAARALILRHRAKDPDETLGYVTRHWSEILGSVQVASPDRAMDVMLNGWLLYQTLACRIWARAGFYQASGAYGFRDQLQDGMALAAIRPEMTRAHLLRAAARQFPEGDVQHWWLPHSGQGVRTRISDDRVWLGYAVAHYVSVTGDDAALDEIVPFIEGPELRPGEHDAFFLPDASVASASLFEHCARGIDQALELTGANGMPLIGTGDWNDGMNRVGEKGRGTSVWLGWLLIAAIRALEPLAARRDPDRAKRWKDHAEAVRAAIERDGWDGAWYRRGAYDDGALLGSAASAECRIDSIAQSWAVLSGAADPERAAIAMASLTEHLVKPDPGLALLFTPPFDGSPSDPGYVKGYPPGLRENGGQYSHAAMWAVLAHARLGDGDSAGALFSLLNPINHALTPLDTARYRVEPYVVAADVYSTPPHVGRGGWTWYTGSAAWMYRAGIEGLLGLSRSGSSITLDPCFPKAWPKLKASIKFGNARLTVTIDNAAGAGRGVVSAALDGREAPVRNGRLVLDLTGSERNLTIVLGVPVNPSRDEMGKAAGS